MHFMWNTVCNIIMVYVTISSHFVFLIDLVWTTLSNSVRLTLLLLRYCRWCPYDCIPDLFKEKHCSEAWCGGNNLFMHLYDFSCLLQMLSTVFISFVYYFIPSFELTGCWPGMKRLNHCNIFVNRSIALLSELNCINICTA